MECKFCHAQMEEGTTLCPVCGKDNTEEAEATAPQEETAEKVVTEAAAEMEAPETEDSAEGTEPSADPAEEAATDAEEPAAPKKKKGGVIALAVILVAAVLGVCAHFGLFGPIGKSGMGENDVTVKTGYTAEGSALSRSADKVIAQMEDKTLTNSQFGIFYWMEYYNYLNKYSSFLSYVGLDTTKDLSTQQSPEEGKTWEQYFIDNALQTWAQFQSLAIEAEKAGFTLNDEIQASLDSMESELQTQAANNGFDTVDAMIQSDFGANVTYADYLNYMTLYYTAYMYYSQEYTNLDTSREVLEQYYDEHKDSFEADGILKDDSPATINVRHILIAPEGGTTDDDGQTTYSDEEWAAAEAKAQEILDGWKAGDATEESFSELANTYSTDPGSNTKGGLYEDVAPGDMVEEFNDWCFADGRAVGDTGIVKTKFGYHIMYFVSASEDLYWEAKAKTEYLTEKGDELLTAPMEAHPYMADYSKIVLARPENLAVTEDTGDQETAGDTAGDTEIQTEGTQAATVSTEAAQG